MKRIWMAFLVAALVLSVAWFFRWDRKEMPVYRGSQIIYLTDRWTGQQWIKYYGKHNGREYAGEEYPKFGSGQFFAVEQSFLPALGYKKPAQERLQLEIARKEAFNKHQNMFDVFENLPPRAYERMDILDKQLQKISQQAYNMASQKLTKEAYAKRYNATYVWLCSVALLAVVTLLSYLLSVRFWSRAPVNSSL